jgi:hypothetical protein
MIDAATSRTAADLLHPGAGELLPPVERGALTICRRERLIRAVEGENGLTWDRERCYAHHARARETAVMVPFVLLPS